MNNVFICTIKPDYRLQVKKLIAIKEDHYYLADCDENGYQIGLSTAYPIEKLNVIGPINETV